MEKPKPSKNTFTVADKEKGAWRLPRGTGAYHTSSDASLFSTSLPVLPHAKFNFDEPDQGGQPLDDDFPILSKVRLEAKVKDRLEDNKPHTMENFLPDDENELLAGLMDDFDLSGLPTQLEDLDDDFFGSGGLEIEPESHESLVDGISRLSTLDGISGVSIPHYGFTNGAGAVTGEHPYGEHPSRTLFVRNINSNVEDSELRALFEQYGDIRTLYTACKHRGFVMISYYDIRSARTAMRALQSKPLRRRKLDIHFSIPKDNPSEKDINQGTLVVFNLDASVSNDDLRQIFGVYGEVKEIRETPHKRHHKFIEFYDVRAAEAALKALNRSDIAGKRIKLEHSRPGGARRSLIQQLSQEQDPDEVRAFLHQVGSPVANSPPGSWPSFGSPVEQTTLRSYNQSLPKLESLSHVGRNDLLGLASILPSHASNPVKITPIGKDPKLSPSPGSTSPFDYPKPSSVGTLSGPQFLWGSPTIQPEDSNSWSSSLKGRPVPGQSIGFPYPGQRGSILGSHHHHHHHHVGSAPSGVPIERHFGFYPNSPEMSYINQGAFRLSNLSGNNSGTQAVNIGAMNMGVTFHGNFADGSSSSGSRLMSVSRNSPLFIGSGSFGSTSNDGLIDRGRSRRSELGNQMDNKKHYQLDLEKINKCNVGYAFINMVSPSHIITFYEAFNGKKWEKFNSEKVASLAYARIQGKMALISHFQNSSLMNEDKRCRPILIQSEGQETIDLESIPSGNLNIFIRQPDGTYSGDSLDSPKGEPNATGS
ncbi:Protein MEI2-like 5 [Striga hermonthica]|uniref:Protein MEI2-like 5 n=1 Tax=Striga hermonthica TaxID=68872 RepID=A0A9N7MQC8_STRHE|nr:Protein MEI2-like 5 [Striga hermonthica]